MALQHQKDALNKIESLLKEHFDGGMVVVFSLGNIENGESRKIEAQFVLEGEKKIVGQVVRESLKSVGEFL